MAVGEENHCVVARAVARPLLRGAQQRRHFVAGEVVAEALFVARANNLPHAPSPSSPLTAPINAAGAASTHRPRASRRGESFPGGEEMGRRRASEAQREGLSTRNLTLRRPRLAHHGQQWG